MVLLALVYLVAGVLFGELASRTSFEGTRIAYRRVAWILSGIAFVAHLYYERRQSTRSRAALHVACGAAVGGSALAGAALVRAVLTRTRPPLLLPLSLIPFPPLL